MALTAQQIVDSRRFMGFSISGDTTSQPYREPVYSNRSLASLSLDYRLAHLSTEEEGVVVNHFLGNLYKREQEIQDASGNLDTDRAAVWYHNRSEVQDRRNLFTALRYELCDFLGFPPGDNLRVQNRLVRA